MNLRMCHCQYCKKSRKTKHVRAEVNAIRGGAKRRTKILIASGLWEYAPTAVSLGYTG
jgi:hypothetical protein